MCRIFPTRRYKPSGQQSVNNDPTLATAGLSTLKRQPSRLVKLNPLASIKPVQTRSAAIPLPPKYRSRSSNTPRVQDVTDSAIRTSLFGPFAQIDHRQHYGSRFDGRPNMIHHDSGCAGVRGSTRCGNDDPVDSVHPSSTSSAKDDFASGGHDNSSHGGHDSSGHVGTVGSGFIGGQSIGFGDRCDTGGGGGGCD